MEKSDHDMGIYDFIPEVQWVFRLNLTQNLCISVNGSKDIVNSFNNIQNVDQLLEQLSRKVVNEDLRQRFRIHYNRGHLLQLHKESKQAESMEIQCHLANQSIHWLRISLRMGENPDTGDVEAFLYGLDVQDIFERGEENLRLPVEGEDAKDKVIAALSQDYLAVYHINLDKNSLVVLRTHHRLDYNVNPGSVKNCRKVIELFNRELVHEKDQKLFSQKTDLEYIKRRLQEEDSFRFYFQMNKKMGLRQYELRIVRREAEDGHMYAVMGIRRIDPDTQKEMEGRKKLSTVYKQVRHSLSQEEQYRRAIVSGAILVYNVNISKNLLEDDAYVMLNGKTASITGMVGLEAPCEARAFYEKFGKERVAEENRKVFLEKTYVGYLKEAFERGETEQVVEFGAYFLENELTIVRQTMLLFKDLNSGDIIGLCNCKDITEAKRQEMATQQALKAALESATLANQAKSDFLSRMSHDIRTPMNAIIGMTAIAGAHLDDRERVKDSLAKIATSSRHLLGIINDILDMSKIESGKLNFNEEEFNLSELLVNLFDMVRPQVKERGHDLRVHIHDLKHEDVIGDSLRIQQAFVNIMSNAVKYTPEGGVITVSISEKPTNKSRAACYEFIFEDNGIGMEKEFIDKIFEPFEREEDLRTSKIQGTGLGMAITKNIINMMGGQIQVDSVVGKGSKFTVTIFLKVQETIEVDTDVLADLPVLVVDDDPISCENTAITLEDIGMNSDWVLSGKEAVELVEEHHQREDDYFAAIIDWKMPDMNGIETTRAIRRVVGDGLPIVIISAYDWSDIELEARAAGANAFISKPAFRSNLTKLFLGLVDTEDSSEGEAEIAEIQKYDFSGIRVLLVEDNDLNREIAVELLEETGMEVEEAEHGKQAVDMFEASEEGYYDMILMDIQMPIMNGYDATVAIRSLNRKDSRNVPIIAMTANAFVEDVHAAISVGMNEHIAKPLDLEVLMQCIRKWSKQ